MERYTATPPRRHPFRNNRQFLHSPEGYKQLLLLLLLLTFSFFKASAYANINLRIPYTFLYSWALLRICYNFWIILKFSEFRSKFQKKIKFSKKILRFRIFENFQIYSIMIFFQIFKIFKLPHLQLLLPQPRSTQGEGICNTLVLLV